MRLGKHISKDDNNWAVSSGKKLKASMRFKMKKIYVSILNELDNEKSDGKIDLDTFNRLRSRVLNMGNDQVRSMESEIDERYNVEFLNYHVEFRNPPEEG